MGQFSWITSDTGRSIPSVDIDHPNAPKQVYFLRPDHEPLLETGYSGYGVFGGIDVYEWMAWANAEHLNIDVNSWDPQRRRSLGIFLESGSIYRDSNGQLWAVFCEDYEFFQKYGIRRAAGNYGQPVVPNGKTPNELIESGEWEELTPSYFGMVKYFIKLTEEPVPYWSVPRSEICPLQGRDFG